MKTLGSRLTCWYAVVVMCTVVSTILIGYWLLHKELVHGVDLLNAAEFREICDRVQTGARPVAQSQFVERLGQHASLDEALYFFQARKDGEVLFRSPNMRGVVFAANPRWPDELDGYVSTVGSRTDRAVRNRQFSGAGRQLAGTASTSSRVTSGGLA